MVSRAVRDVLGLLAALVATGCFEVHSVETGPLIIDDFENGSVSPPDPTFQSWGCQKFSPPTMGGYQCEIDDTTAYQGNHSLYVDATIEDLLDGVQRQGGAFLETIANTTKDFGRFSRLVFAAKLDSDSLPPLSTPTLEVQIGCNLAELTAGPRPDSIYVSSRTETPGGDWQVLTVEFGDLTMPMDPMPVVMSARLKERSPGCLKVVDAIRFDVAAGLPDGQSGRFILHIDDVELE